MPLLKCDEQIKGDSIPIVLNNHCLSPACYFLPLRLLYQWYTVLQYENCKPPVIADSWIVSASYQIPGPLVDPSPSSASARRAIYGRYRLLLPRCQSGTTPVFFLSSGNRAGSNLPLSTALRAAIYACWEIVSHSVACCYCFSYVPPYLSTVGRLADFASENADFEFNTADFGGENADFSKNGTENGKIMPILRPVRRWNAESAADFADFSLYYVPVHGSRACFSTNSDIHP